MNMHRLDQKLDPRWVITGIVAGAALGVSAYTSIHQPKPEPVYVYVQMPAAWNGQPVVNLNGQGLPVPTDSSGRPVPGATVLTVSNPSVSNDNVYVQVSRASR